MTKEGKAEELADEYAGRLSQGLSITEGLKAIDLTKLSRKKNTVARREKDRSARAKEGERLAQGEVLKSTERTMHRLLKA